MKCPFCIKVCSKCKRILVANNSNFHRIKGGKYGLNSVCKACKKKYVESNESYKEYQKQWHKENVSRYKEYRNNWRKENEPHLKEHQKKYQKEYQKEWYKKNKEEKKKYVKQWREENSEKVFNYNNKRRQREENQGNGITKEQWLEMMEFFDWKCAYSGEYIGNNSELRTIDHIIPLSKGGLNEPWNCVPMCRSYNISKHVENMEDWYVEQNFFDIDRLLKIYEWIEYAYNKFK